MSREPIPEGGLSRFPPYQSCVVCLKGDVNTVIAIRGEPEWAIAVLNRLGLSMEEANSTFLYIAETEYGCDRGMVPDRDVNQLYRVCKECGKKIGLTPVVPTEGAIVPVADQPAETRKPFGED